MGKRAVIRFGFPDLPDKDVVFFAFAGQQQVSNGLLLHKKDFTPGNGEEVYQAEVAKLTAGIPSSKTPTK
jgi:hypothetical protein